MPSPLAVLQGLCFDETRTVPSSVSKLEGLLSTMVGCQVRVGALHEQRGPGVVVWECQSYHRSNSTAGAGAAAAISQNEVGAC